MPSVIQALKSKTVKAAVFTMIIGLVQYKTEAIIRTIGDANAGLLLTLVGGVFLVLRAITTEALSDK